MLSKNIMNKIIKHEQHLTNILVRHVALFLTFIYFYNSKIAYSFP